MIAATRPNSAMTALVLAGGGLTGAVYHIGALRAIDDMLVDRTVNDFDIYVGTSAGALIVSLLANDLSPDVMMQALGGTQLGLPVINQRQIFSVNQRDLLNWGFKLPKKLLDIGSQYLHNIGDMTFFDVLWSMAEAIPPGLYDGMGLERYVRRLLETPGRSNDFDKLKRELYIIATDLDTGERVIFGAGEQSDIPISLAVAASSALPLLYKPLRIGKREYVDGGLRGTASLDLAIEHGATLIVCINPMVPYDNGSGYGASIPELNKEFLSEKGIRAVADQTLRITGHSGLQYHIKQLRRRHPEIDIILIEPHPDDYQMFFNNIMRYSARLVVAQHGFESVTLKLSDEYQRYKSILRRHHIPITRRLVIKELNEIHESGDDPEVIRRVMEARSAACGRNRLDTPVCQLTRILAELEMILDDMPAE